MSVELTAFDVEKAKAEIKLLVEKYEREKSNNKLESYSEEQTKNDFILRLFKALGWDVYNDHSNTLTAEEKASRGRVDYGFRINDIPKFFLEAKSFKAGVDKDEYAFQAINYAWLKGCTWAILTNFEKLIIYNAEWKEKLAINCLFISLNYKDFLTNFDQLYLLSREAFTKNLLDQAAEKWHKKIKKTPIDQQLLLDLTKFRETLTQSIVRRNASLNLTEEELDESVQKILDRIIFIRTVEDRQIEPPRLRPLIREDHKGNLWKKLVELYMYFDKEYDSNLFTQRHELEKLVIGDIELETIIHGLHETDDGAVQYDFSAINVDVLGNVYEQYLGHILKKTKKGAKITNGASKRKEQGIFYTPTYIVDYIVKNTVGSKIAEMGSDWKKIRILDPACGSGSFLIKTFDYLTSLDKELEKKEELKKDLYGTHIATERFGYLKNNIFGVDLDSKAVEIAQLNLMIRATERKERLPSLQQNIKNGDSLIDDHSIAGNKAFQWKSEFPNIVNNGGFDVIIGNPPYVRQEELLSFKSYLQSNYEVFNSMADLFVYFFERELKLLKNEGYFGMIVNNKWLKTGYGLNLRKFLGKFWIEQFIDFGDLQLFKDATTYPCIIIIRKKLEQNPKIKVCLIKSLDFDSLSSYVEQNYFFFDQRELDPNGWNFQNIQIINLLKKIHTKSLPLKEYIKDQYYFGIKTGLTDAFVIDETIRQSLIQEDPKSDEIIKPFLTGKEVKRYGVQFANKYIILTKIGIDINRYPAIFKWLNKFKNDLEERADQGDHWYELRACSYYDLFGKPKIVYGAITVAPRFALDYGGYFANNANFFLPTEDKQLLGILNSKLGWFLIQNTCTQVRGGYQLIWQYFGNVPIIKQRNIELEKLVENMILLNKELIELGNKMTGRRSQLEEQIKRIDSDIDNAVYDIYGLDEFERKIIEDSIK
jgi:predicted type IV restriction endonuclease